MSQALKMLYGKQSDSPRFSISKGYLTMERLRGFIGGGVWILLALALWNPSTATATPFNLGDAAQFVILGDENTYEVGNKSQITGNIGVGPGGMLNLSGGPFNLTGSIYFADPVVPGTNYITSGINNISGSVTQDNALVTLALSALTTLYTTALGVYDPLQATKNLNASTTIGPGNYNFANVDLNSDTITFTGSSNDYIIVNVKNELKINNSHFILTGGIPVDHILWNLIQSGDGGDASKNVTIGGSDTQFAGVFLALDRKISISDNNGTGRFYGGKSTQTDKDFTFVSGVTLAAPTTPVPEPGSLFLLGSGLIGIVGFARRKFRK